MKPQKGKIVKFRSFKEFDDVEKYKSDLSLQAPWHVCEILDTMDDKAKFVGKILSSIVDTHL